MDNVDAPVIERDHVTNAVPEQPSNTEHEPLLAACRLVGSALGITIRSVPQPLSNPSQRAPLAEIARASHMRTRQVILSGEWWCQDNGPLLAYRQADKQPVALLPQEARHYDLVDPLVPGKRRVDAEIAATLTSFAVMFYRPLPKQPLDGWNLLRFSLSGSRNDLLTITVASLVGGLLALVMPLAVGLLFGMIVPAAQRNQLVLLGLALGVSLLFAALVLLTQNIAGLRTVGRMRAMTEAGVWDRLMNLPVNFFRSYAPGDLLSLTRSIGASQHTLTHNAIGLSRSALIAVVSLLLLGWYDGWLGLLALGLTVLFALGTSMINWRQGGQQRVMNAREGYLSGLVLQFISGVAKLRVAGAEDRAFQEWARVWQQQKQQAYKVGLLDNALVVWNSIFPLLAMLVMAGALIRSGTLRLPLWAVLTCAVAFTQLLLATRMISTLLPSRWSSHLRGGGITPLLRALPEEDVARRHPGELAGALEVRNLSFRYQSDGPLILSDVSLHIHPGEFVAFVGPSGSGKSTLLRLLLGFEQPQAGTIEYDGQDLATLDIREVRRQLGVVLQDGALLADDIFHNIIGTSLLTVEDAWEAARMVGLDAEIRRLPMGMYTVVPEGGSTFSGGQRQRLLIARAIVHRPRILLFDEATSALDSISQSVVTASLDQLLATRIVIAHRLSTIVNADRIFVLDAGRIVQTGTYAELMQQDGIFADLARRQIA